MPVPAGRHEQDDEVTALATLAQLARKLGYLPEGDEGERAEFLLGEASELIRDVAGKTWLDDDGLLDAVPSRIVKICVAVAFRAFNNPEALTQKSIGDMAKAYDRTRLQGGEAVYLTDVEEKAVRKAAQASTFTSVALVSPWSDNGTESLVL